MISSEQKKTRFPWTLWFKWVMLSAMGHIIGVLTGGSLAFIFFQTDDIRFALVLGLIAGLILGFAQWLVLRKLMNGVGWWIWVTTIGLAMGDPLGTIVVTTGERMIPNLFAASLGSVVIGTLLGFLQWLILRKNFESGSTIWIAATIISSFIGTLVRRIPNGPILGLLATSIVSAAITGFALVWLMQRSQQNVLNQDV